MEEGVRAAGSDSTSVDTDEKQQAAGGLCPLVFHGVVFESADRVSLTIVIAFFLQILFRLCPLRVAELA